MDRNQNFETFFNDKSAPKLLGEYLHPFCVEDTVLLCIGTDKCIGDCLGPLIGTLLKKSSFSLPVYGTLESPVHAVNLEERIKSIKKRHPSSLIIAIDACLSDTEKIGNIEIRHGPIYPGKGIGKSLPPIGDMSIIGIVDDIDNNSKISLHTIRLHFIMKMAEVIVQGLLNSVLKENKEG